MVKTPLLLLYNRPLFGAWGGLFSCQGTGAAIYLKAFALGKAAIIELFPPRINRGRLREHPIHGHPRY